MDVTSDTGHAGRRRIPRAQHSTTSREQTSCSLREGTVMDRTLSHCSLTTYMGRTVLMYKWEGSNVWLRLDL